MNLVTPLKPVELPTRGPAAPRQVAAKLTFRRHGSRSFLAHQHTPHPFHLTRPFYLPGDPQGMATLYLQSSSGGLYGDDDLSLHIALEEGAGAHVTTQASTIVHAARGGTTQQSVVLDCGKESLLEYLPDPLILFAGARLRARFSAQLDRSAALIFADSFLVHDPGAGTSIFERFENDIVIRRRGEDLPLLIERQYLAATDWPAAGSLSLPSYGCHGSLGVISDCPCDEVAAAVKRGIAEAGLDRAACYAGVNALPERGLVWTRFLCRDGAALSGALAAAWCGARLALTGRQPPPRKK